MTSKLLTRWPALLGLAALLSTGVASAWEVRVMISAGFFPVYAELGPAFERATGHRLVTIRGARVSRAITLPLQDGFEKRPTKETPMLSSI